MLAKLCLKDFMIFKGRQEISFSSNTTIVLTNHRGGGKTTLMQSIYWCLYGETIDFNRTHNYLNRKRFFELSEGDKEYVSVSLTFKTLEGEVELERIQEYVKRNDGLRLTNVRLLVNGYENGKKYETVAEKILPRSIAEWFLWTLLAPSGLGKFRVRPILEDYFDENDKKEIIKESNRIFNNNYSREVEREIQYNKGEFYLYEKDKQLFFEISIRASMCKRIISTKNIEFPLLLDGMNDYIINEHKEHFSNMLDESHSVQKIIACYPFVSLEKIKIIFTNIEDIYMINSNDEGSGAVIEKFK